jgi:hypothetical protein
MPCLFALVAGMFPRIGTFILWLARPAMFTQAFHGNWFWPLLGIIFLPFTTLMYVILAGATGLYGWDWLWIALAVFLDISHTSSTLYNNRKQIPGMSSTPTTPPTA